MMASLQKISGTLHNKETSLVKKSKSRLGNELTVQEVVFSDKKRKKNSMNQNLSDSPESDESPKRKKKRSKQSDAKREREVKVKMKEIKMKLEKEKLKQEKMELEAVILRLQRAKLLLEMEKLSEERERISVEKSNISLRYDILSLHSQLSGPPSHVTWRPSSDNNKEDSTFVTANTANIGTSSNSIVTANTANIGTSSSNSIVTANTANIGTSSSNSKNVGIASDPAVITPSLSSVRQKKLTRLSAADNSVTTNLGLVSNSSIPEVHKKKVPVFYLCSTDPNLKGNIGIATPLHAGQVKKGVVLSRKIKTNQVAIDPKQQPATIAIQHNLPPRIQHPQNTSAQPSVVTSKPSNVPVMMGEPELPPTYPCVKNKLKERFILPATSMLDNTVVSRTSVMRFLDTRSFSALSQPWKQIANTDGVQHGSIIISDKSVGNKLNKGDAIIIPDNLYDGERTEVKLELQSD